MKVHQRKNLLEATLHHSLLCVTGTHCRQRMFAPVKIASRLTGTHQIIYSVEGFSEYLTEEPSPRQTEVYEKALQVCIDGLCDRISPQSVREALVWMATAEGISIIA